jgi:eukaryotic-like serine/threonine-protein kinase
MRGPSQSELACLGEETLAAFAEGQVDEASQERIEEHLADCADCRVVLTRAAGVTVSDGHPSGVVSGSAVDEQPLSNGTRVGRYVIRSLIGRGAMGAVYVATDPDLDRNVAVKLLRANTWSDDARRKMRARLLREAQAMARLSHPEVITVYDVGAFGDQLFVAMEYVEGDTLRRWRAARHRTHAEILEVYERAGSGLAAAHEAGLVHRDFKPDNVLVGRDGRVRVTDFGLARTVDRADAQAPRSATDAEGSAGDGLPITLTRNGTLLGTPGYMAPEQLRGGAADARSDVFSFCVALYEALYGERPFSGSTVVALRREVEQGRLRVPPIMGRVPGWLRTVLLRGLRASPDERFASMRALLDALRAAHAASRRRATWAGGIALAIVASAAMAAAVRSGPRPEAADVAAQPRASPVISPSAQPMPPAAGDFATSLLPAFAPASPPSSVRLAPMTTERQTLAAPRTIRAPAPSASTAAPLVGHNGAFILE